MLVVMHYFAPHIGGMEEVGRSQASSLARLGHRVTVWTWAHRRGLPVDEEVGGYRVRRSRAINLIESRFGVTFPIPSPLALPALLLSVGRAGVVHIHEVLYLPAQLAFLAAVLRRRPYFLTQHVAMVDHPSRLVMAVQRALYSTVGRAMFSRAERVIVYNARVRDFVVAHGADPGRVVMNHNGIDTAHFRPAPAGAKRRLRERYGLPADRPVALFVGRLVPKKGFDLVMAAADPAWTTLIVGEGAGPRPPAGPGVVMFGPADRTQVRDLYRLADVFVFPAVGELFTLVMQEAMSTGLPVVTTDDPAYDEYGLDRELIRFVGRHPEELHRAVADITTSPELTARMGEYSRRVALERFSWEANYHREYAAYGGFAGGAHAGPRREVGRGPRAAG
ncbi:MAG TPA: glycosyltransferase family 4 protein [Acidimicrobiales bacterium]|nr:glycosyltransferase family 4 protein [Acidimicrobiales bacterium]